MYCTVLFCMSTVHLATGSPGLGGRSGDPKLPPIPPIGVRRTGGAGTMVSELLERVEEGARLDHREKIYCLNTGL